MEEASVAGESPDRSKQRESSAEPTSGSAGPVPGARSEARDPRLAPAGGSGESGTTSGASGGPGGSGTAKSRGGVDTATRVLSVRNVVTDAQDDPESGESQESGGGAAEAVRTAGKSGGAGAAVSGAAGADENEDEKGRGDTEDAESGGGGDRAAAPGDARLRAAVAAWVDSEGTEESGDRKDSDGRKDAGTAAEAGETEEPDASDSQGESEADTDGQDREPAAAPQRAADGKDGEGDKGGKDGKSGEAGKTAEPGAPAKTPDAKTTDAQASGSKTPSSKTPESEAASGPEAEPSVDTPTAVFKAPRPAVDQPTTMLKLGGAQRGDAKNAAKSGAENAPKTGAKAAPKTDAGNAAKTGAKGGTAAEGAAKGPRQADGGSAPKPAPGAGESEAERTSKFVALKPLDDAPKTAPGAPAAPAATPTPTARNHRPGFEPTTQQPLPPKPPLDLLAELTNTPPPPETPLRTTVRRVKIWTPLVLLLLVVFAIVQALRPLPAPGLALTAKDNYTFEGSKLTLPWPGEGQGWMDVEGVGTMDHFGEQKPAPIGSVAKTMTAYIILRDHPLKVGQEGPKIKIDPQAEKEGGYDKTGDESTLNTVKAGQTLTEKQALSAVMIPSANNIARLLARWDAGSEAAFVKKMNATAKELGMANTTYTDPSGLTKTTVSTAEDQVKLGDQVVKNPALVAITSAASWTDPSGKNWPNWNELPYRMGAIGIKTGSTTAAGGNLLFAARKKVGGQTVTVVGAILGQRKSPILTTVNQVSKTALEAAKGALTSAKILKKGDVVGYVDDRLGGHTPVVVTEDVTAVGWAGSQVKVSFAPDQVPHSAKAGTKVGTLTVGEGGAGGAVRVPVALQTDLSEPGFTDKLTRLG
ncbi:D-alanyl-D-alanine carboxypeptidase [Streptomyces sp. NPDC006743]|uniref:D-alanyl-D-alanine carboxypeptidase n=1 Tax=Streptomyces sp. NPDC006743 TaxID=3154480 RepID=UPI0034565B01